MNKDTINRTIAEALGWKPCTKGCEGKTWRYPDDSGCTDILPDYTDCLNAIHAAILQLVTSKIAKAAFSESLTAIINRNHDGEHRFLGASPFHHATAEASELCEALLIQQRLWTPTGEENE